jgi:hypothetical protein
MTQTFDKPHRPLLVAASFPVTIRDMMLIREGMMLICDKSTNMNEIDHAQAIYNDLGDILKTMPHPQVRP